LRISFLDVQNISHAMEALVRFRALSERLPLGNFRVFDAPKSTSLGKSPAIALISGQKEEAISRVP
jgi:hypothetical protein